MAYRHSMALRGWTMMKPTDYLKLCALISIGVVTASTATAQSFGVYEGQLENGWQNWSWCATDTANMQHVHRAGVASIRATYSSGYQGLYLSYGPFNSSYFSGISFYIYGAPIAGNTINVAAIVDGNPKGGLDLSSFVVGGPLPANMWKQVVVPLSALGVSPTDRVSGFWLQEGSGKSQPAFWVADATWVPQAPPDLVDIGIDAGGSLQTVSPKVYGVNTAVWNDAFTSPTCVSRIQEERFRSFRFPGGSLSDTYHWKTNTTDSNQWTWATSFDAFASVTKPQAANSFITVNYGTGTPAEAAGWVKYSNITKKYGYKYWEVGNENYGGWEADAHARANDPYIYAQQFALYYQAMKAQDPTIKVGAVANPGEDSFATYNDHTVTNPVTGVSHNGWTPVLLAKMKDLGVTPDFIIYHNYPQSGRESDFGLLQSTSAWPGDVGSLRQMLHDYLGAAGASVEIDCTENNSDATNPGKQMCSLVNGLYLADSFASSIQTECKSFVWWDLLNGQGSNGNNGSWLYGWRPYGDYGVMSTSFERYPVFYVHKLLSLFASPGDTVLPVTTSYGMLTAYATKRNDQSLRVMVVNKSATATLSASLHFSGYAPTSFAQRYSYGMTEDNAAQSGVGSPDLSFGTLGNVGVDTPATFPPYSVTVLLFKAKGYFYPGAKSGSVH